MRCGQFRLRTEKNTNGEGKSKMKVAREQIKDIRESKQRKEKKGGKDNHDVRSSDRANKDDK
jgi:hypothetical protein